MVLVETTPQEWELRLITSERDEKKKRQKEGNWGGPITSQHHGTVITPSQFLDSSTLLVAQFSSH